jgi:signal peptidase I
MPRSLATTGTRARALAHVAGRGLMSVLLLAILGAMVITFAPSLFGYQRYVLIGHSMEPTIHRGSLVFDEIVNVSDLRKGDVITYVPPGNLEPVTHRLISRKVKKKGGAPIFRTKGDNNPVADPRTFQLIRQKQARFAFSVPYLGWLFIALGTPKVRFILLVIPALLIALSMLVRLWREGGRLTAAQREAG